MRLSIAAVIIYLLATELIGSIRQDFEWAKIGENVHPGTINFKLKSGISTLNISQTEYMAETGISDIDAVAALYGIYTIEKIFMMEETPKDSNIPDLTRYYVAYFPEAFDPYDVGVALEQCPQIEFAEYVRIQRYEYVPNDPRFNAQWHLRHCGFPSAWEETRGSPDIVIGIVDSGMDMPFDEFGEPQIHEDIAGNIWVNPGEDLNHDGVITLDDWDGRDNDENGYADDFHGWNLTENNNWPHDANSPEGVGHGTHVAGCASASTDNETGVGAPAFSASLMIAACYSPGQDSLIRQGYRGIEYCGRAGANIINCSWGGTYAASAIERDAINFARALGCIVFAAAGNDNQNDRRQDRVHHFPSAYDGVIGIAASNSADRKAGFSNYGEFIDLVAPGEGILSTIPHNRYASYPGTSMASPLAAGLGALILSVRDLNEAELLQWMQRTAVDISEDNADYNGIRYRINADFAINAIHPSYNLIEWNLLELDGNQDGRADPEETCVIEVVVENRDGYADAINGVARLSNPDTTLRVQRGQVRLGDFGGGQQVFNGGPEGLRFLVRHFARPHYTKFTLTVTDESGHVNQIEIPMTIGHPDYLLVDDDDGGAFDSLFHNDLLARPLVHDVWRVTDSGSPTLEALSGYKNVVWETGNARNGLTEAEQNTLGQFLSSGGKGLIISGQFLSEDIGETDFHRNFLHARQVSENTAERQLVGFPGSPISDGLELILIGGGGAGNSTSPSSFEPINGADTLFTYNNSGEVGGLFFTGAGYSVVYFGFALEAVSGGGRTTTRTEVLEKALDHFYALKSPDEEAPHAPDQFSLDSPYPNPFNPETSVKMSGPAGREFTLQVVDLSGRVVATLHEGAGSHGGRFVWDGNEAPAGIYLFRLAWDGGAIVRKAALIK